MKTIATHFRASEFPEILQARVRQRIRAAAEKWDHGDGDVEVVWQKEPGNEPQLVVYIVDALASQADSLAAKCLAEIGVAV